MIVMRLIKEKMRERIHVHYSVDTLHKHLAKENLPVNLGGDLEDEEAVDSNLVTEMLRKNIPYKGIECVLFTNAKLNKTID